MKELDILELRRLYKNDMVFLTSHCSLRLEQRGISEDDIESALNNGEIIEQYPEDYPWPSCLILGCSDNRPASHMSGFKRGSREADYRLLA